MLTQTEADALIGMRKTFVDDPPTATYPGQDETYELAADATKERFLLDLWRGTIRLSKVRMQTRGRKVIVLVRFEIDGPRHTNPDGTTLEGTHVHLYREGYEDKWAFPVDAAQFTDLTSIAHAYADFCRYCNIEGGSHLQEGML